MSYTDRTVEACHQIIALEAQLANMKKFRDAAIVAMHEHDGVPKSRISDSLRSRLALGSAKRFPLTEAQIEGLGVSEWSVRRVFDKAREKEDTSVNR